MAEEFKPITSQEELDKAIEAHIDKFIGKRLEKNTKQVEERFAGYLSPEQHDEKTKELNSQIATLTEQLAKANETIETNTSLIAEKDKAIREGEINSIKTRIALEMGISTDNLENASRVLTGESEEEIRNSAETLKSLFGTKTAPMARPEGADVDSDKAELKSMLNNLF